MYTYIVVRTEAGWDVYRNGQHIADVSTWKAVLAITHGDHMLTSSPAWCMQP